MLRVFPSLFPAGSTLLAGVVWVWSTALVDCCRVTAGRRDVELLERWLDENAQEDFEPLKHMEAMSKRAAATANAGGPASGESLATRQAQMAKLSRETDEQLMRSADILKKVRIANFVAR